MRGDNEGPVGEVENELFLALLLFWTLPIEAQ